MQLQLEEVRTRMAEHGLTLELTNAATNLLIDKGYNADYGARPLRRAIERLIEDPMAEHLLREEIGEGVTLYADINDEADALVFTQEPPATREPEPAKTTAE